MVTTAAREIGCAAEVRLVWRPRNASLWRNRL